MNPVFNPDTPQEILLLAFLGLCSLAGLVIPVWIQNQRQQRDLSSIKDQVKNDHPTNLRDDMDYLRADLSELKSLVLEGFSNIRKNINQEREERISGDQWRCNRI